MQNKFFYFLGLFFLLNFQFLQASNLDGKLQHADSLFEQKKYTESFEIYQEIMEADEQASPRMLLKMAFIKEGLGDYSKALYFLNIYYLETSDKRVRTKMKEIAEQHNLSGFVISDGDFFINVIRQYQFPIFIILIIGILITGSYLGYLKIVKKRNPIISAISFVVILGAAFYAVNYATEIEQAIIIENNTYLMSGPSSGADLIEIVEKGHRVKTFGENGPWLEILWGDQKVFIKKSKVKRLG